MDSGLAHDQWVGIAICELCFQSALSVSSSRKCCRQVFHSFCMHRCLPMLMHAYVCLRMHVHAYACLCMCMHMHAYANACICICNARVRETLEKDAGLKTANRDNKLVQKEIRRQGPWIGPVPVICGLFTSRGRRGHIKR